MFNSCQPGSVEIDDEGVGKTSAQGFLARSTGQTFHISGNIARSMLPALRAKTRRSLLFSGSETKTRATLRSYRDACRRIKSRNPRNVEDEGHPPTDPWALNALRSEALVWEDRGKNRDVPLSIEPSNQCEPALIFENSKATKGETFFAPSPSRPALLPRLVFIADDGRVVLTENRGIMRVVFELQQIV